MFYLLTLNYIYILYRLINGEFMKSELNTSVLALALVTLCTTSAPAANVDIPHVGIVETNNLTLPEILELMKENPGRVAIELEHAINRHEFNTQFLRPMVGDRGILNGADQIARQIVENVLNCRPAKPEVQALKENTYSHFSDWNFGLN
jgi:hypothetical protein